MRCVLHIKMETFWQEFLELRMRQPHSEAPTAAGKDACDRLTCTKLRGKHACMAIKQILQIERVGEILTW